MLLKNVVFVFTCILFWQTVDLKTVLKIVLSHIRKCVTSDVILHMSIVLLSCALLEVSPWGMDEHYLKIA